ncbi:TPA: SDR family oxidoreductase [Klebsiella aerogenes]|uniref:SDR family oxidoreductase n=1 Tax=Pantoea TaxID=53335 RepID=UPI00241385E1|nr:MULTISPECIES: SDR family oxidoreductase [Pantoea]HDS2562794.1 SDR family oxidoreductase [Klebsiella aerogenes]WHQ73443.1 SDR family oxidoreductase [Pantoea sp. Lij88]HDS6533997.1 SDR family oxidoreductase [Klebsiella aerogenes]HDT0788422.1 SDR family oxidoreductase [Klebsiella aerogenes]HDT1125531.1 SDR family oxidoreductase [Klebsiella aerogenes]
MNHLQNKTAVITGASSGIGAATALELARHGVNIVAAALDQTGLDKLVKDIESAGGHASGLVTDVTRLEDTQALVKHATDTFGTVDILINNAGLMLFSAWSDIAWDDWNKMVDVNIKGYLNAIASVLPVMLSKSDGQILNMASVAGHQVDAGAGVYSSTKFFVHAMTESMRKDLGVNKGIRVNTISPGVINTGWADKVSDPEGRKVAQELTKIAISPQDVANAVVYALNQPRNVTVNDLIVSPTKQNW